MGNKITITLFTKKSKPDLLCNRTKIKYRYKYSTGFCRVKTVENVCCR